MRQLGIAVLSLILPILVGDLNVGAPRAPGNVDSALEEGGRSASDDQTSLAVVPPPDTVPATGSISGTVMSVSGARLPGATITFVQAETGRVQRVVSGEMGIFRVARLVEGSYQVTAELPGFLPETVQDVVVQRDLSQTVNLSLQQSFRIENHIMVLGSAPQYSLESAEIREGSARDVGEALAQRPGVWRVRKGGIANDVVIRGFQGRDLNILIDGQRIFGACPNNMDPSAFHVDFAEVDRVDFSKGPFDVKNEGGIGGTVSIITRRPESGWRAGGNIGLGSFGFMNPSAGASFANKHFSVLGGYSYRRSSPYLDGDGRKFTELANYRAGVRDRNAFEVGTAWARIGVSATENQHIQVAYARQRADEMLYPYLQMDAVYDDADRFGFRWDARTVGNTLTGFSLQAYYTEVSHWMTDALRTSATGTRGYSVGTLAATRALGGRFEAGLVRNWTVGFEAYHRFWGAATEMAGTGYRPQYSLPDVDVNSIGMYAEYRRPLSDVLTLTGGVRVDRVESRADEARANTDLYFAYNDTASTSAVDTFPSGNLRLEHRSSSGFGMSVGAGSAVQVPEPTERYFALKRMGSDWVGNPRLSPSRNNGIEGSLSFERGGFYLYSDVFVNWVDDFVGLVGRPRINEVAGIMNASARSYTNLDARLSGTEVSVVLPLQDRLFLSGDVSYVRGTRTPIPEIGIHSRNLSEMPPLRSRAVLRYDDGRLFGSAEGVFSAAQRETDLDLEEGETPSHAILNLSAGARRGRVTFTTGIGNLFNRTYAEHLSYQRDPFRSGVRVMEPGRSVFVNLGVGF